MGGSAIGHAVGSAGDAAKSVVGGAAGSVGNAVKSVVPGVSAAAGNAANTAGSAVTSVGNAATTVAGQNSASGTQSSADPKDAGYAEKHKRQKSSGRRLLLILGIVYAVLTVLAVVVFMVCTNNKPDTRWPTGHAHAM